MEHPPSEIVERMEKSERKKRERLEGERREKSERRERRKEEEKKEKRGREERSHACEPPASTTRTSESHTPKRERTENHVASARETVDVDP